MAHAKNHKAASFRGALRGSALSAEELPPIEHRPILNVGLLLVMLVVISLIVLGTLEALGGRLVFVPATQNPWPAVAWLCLAFCVPAIVAVGYIVLKNMLISRRVRYACASIAVVSLAIVSTLALLALIGSPKQFWTFDCRSRLDDLLGPLGLFWMIGTGFLFGISLPTVHSEKPELTSPRPSRRRVTFYVLTGLVIAIVFYLIFLLGPPSETASSYPSEPARPDWAGWFRDMVALPAVAYQGSTLGIALLGRFVNLPMPPRNLRAFMVAIPLVAWGAIALGGVFAGVSGLAPGIAWIVLVSFVYAFLGVAPGIVIAAMRD